ncbi:MAG: Ribonuclease [Pseudomonadota bacterium]
MPKQLQALLGETHFSDLMRTKPLARTDAYFLHIKITPLQDKLNEKLKVNPTVYLGIIVPKKAYPLAVDRNRIRRLLRAHCVTYLVALIQLASTKNCDLAGSVALNVPYHIQHNIRCLFRVKNLPKQKTLFKNQLIPHQSYLNPHSAVFSQCLRTMFEQVVQQLLRTYPSLIETGMQ